MNISIQKKKIAIVYDWIDSWGGVERVLLDLYQLFPHADFYTSYVDLDKAPWAKNLTIYPSFIQKLPNFIKKNRILSLPLYSYAFESFNLSQYDIVISISSAFAKGVITKPHTRHICYLLTPPRYLWGQSDDYETKSDLSWSAKFKKMLKQLLVRRLRALDFIAAQRPDEIVSISNTVAARCRKYYQRASDVLFPPFDIDYWSKLKNEVSAFDLPKQDKYYLVVSRLEPYKKVDLVISTFNRNKKRLVIIGRGTQKDKLTKMANKNIAFIENVTDKQLALWYYHAEALIMPQEEDFGYVALEAQLMGCPVVAYGVGGAVETVKENISGMFFASQSEKALEEALERLKVSAYNVRHTLHSINSFLETFSKAQFLNKMQSYISDTL
ncbi:glycosyltransferase family 4 protein [soil metagenome]